MDCPDCLHDWALHCDDGIDRFRQPTCAVFGCECHKDPPYMNLGAVAKVDGVWEDVWPALQQQCPCTETCPERLFTVMVIEDPETDGASVSVGFKLRMVPERDIVLHSIDAEAAELLA